ncbi:hypothetical protein [Chitinophaga niabensis]|uniref:Uncharacterized protein n=1 Tax=Chitinophaga niabensis TaxID=536979 RepID=A0A1N6EKD4_9BACT|nr:hypothetical protein [Chitinophaga niabensis]SIN83522.1 hypothetical protein SAMN04488055_1677 [Chitinophaga niabensis]
MLNYAPDISFKGRFRIILLLVLSLCSCISYILPSGPGQGYFQESLLYENENPEACKLSLGIETSVKNKRTFSKQQFAGICNTVTHSDEYFHLASWIRPAYYNFLHRFSLF